MKLLIKTLQVTASLALGSLAISQPSSAQVVPDNTLPNNTIVNIEENNRLITGGTTAGDSLFHSFREFSLVTGNTAFFDNAVNINQIIVRVTGGKLSNIDGLMKANGRANLFFLNPNGIAFGPNAQLDIGGSFFASTAESLLFEDGSYSATAPTAPPLLTISIPVGLQFGANPGKIVNQSQATRVGADGAETAVGLQVNPGRTLALVGGEIELEGGQLSSAAGSVDLAAVGATLLDNNESAVVVQQTSGGRIEVGAVAGNSQVRIFGQIENPQKVLDYSGVENFQDIELSRLAVIDASGDGGGDIQIQGRRLTVSEGSQIRSNTLGANPGGTLRIRATESVEAIGNTLIDGPIDTRLAAAGILVPRETSLSTTSFAAGKAGDLIIETGKLIVRDGAEISAFSFGTGAGGNIAIAASESVEVVGTGISVGLDPALFFSFGVDAAIPNDLFLQELPLVSLISTSSVGDGLAGNLSIETGRLSLRDGGGISSTPLFGGDGGMLEIVASEAIEVIGTTENGIVRSSIASSTVGSGNAKDLALNTNLLTVRDGGEVSAFTLNTGEAGNLLINASESIEVSGSSRDGRFRSSLSASSFGEGNAGNLRIDANEFIIRNGAEVAVNSTASGNAGNLEITANSLLVEGGATINAATISGLGGNLNLRAQQLQLRDRSSLTTNAGSTDGGNINIDTDILVALENSDITANAQQGRGGQVVIQTQGIFGTEFRQRLTPQSDITATSELGSEFSGRAVIITPEVDPSAGLIELTAKPSDLMEKGIARCSAVEGSSFYITGHGGLPADPTAPIRGQTIWEDMRRFPEPQGDAALETEVEEAAALNPQVAQLDADSEQTLVEATGLKMHPDGTVELVAAREDEKAPYLGVRSSCYHE